MTSILRLTNYMKFKFCVYKRFAGPATAVYFHFIHCSLHARIAKLKWLWKPHSPKHECCFFTKCVLTVILAQAKFLPLCVLLSLWGSLGHSSFGPGSMSLTLSGLS